MTGDLLLDWSQFQQGAVSPAKAFEAFSSQLFDLLAALRKVGTESVWRQSPVLYATRHWRGR
jgi:hypothetical protein